MGSCLSDLFGCQCGVWCFGWLLVCGCSSGCRLWNSWDQSLPQRHLSSRTRPHTGTLGKSSGGVFFSCQVWLYYTILWDCTIGFSGAPLPQPLHSPTISHPLVQYCVASSYRHAHFLIPCTVVFLLARKDPWSTLDLSLELRWVRGRLWPSGLTPRGRNFKIFGRMITSYWYLLKCGDGIGDNNHV